MNDMPQKEYVYVQSTNGEVQKREVLRRTPSGQTIVRISDTYEQRFDKKGHEIGSGSKYLSAFLVSEDRYLRSKEEKAHLKRCREAETEIKKATELFNRYGWVKKEDLVVALKAALAKAEAI